MKKTKHFNISVPELGDVPDITQVSNAISDLEDATAGTLEIMKAEMQGTKITLTSVSRKTKRTGYYEGMSIRFKSPQDIEPNYLKTISVDGLVDQTLSVEYKVNRNEYIDIVYEENKFTAYPVVVQKTDSISNNSSILVGTAKGVKTAYDKGVEALNKANQAQSSADEAQSTADGKVSKSGDTINGELVFNTSHEPKGLIKYDLAVSESYNGWAHTNNTWYANGAEVFTHGVFGNKTTPQYIYWGKNYNDNMLRLYLDGRVELKASNLKTGYKEVVLAINELYDGKENAFSKNSGFNKDKTDNYNGNDTNQLFTQKGANDLYKEVETELEKKANLSGADFTGTIFSPHYTVKDKHGRVAGGIYYNDEYKFITFSNAASSATSLSLKDNGDVVVRANNLTVPHGDKDLIEAINWMYNYNQMKVYSPINIDNTNAAIYPGTCFFNTATLNAPCSYGQLIAFVNDANAHNNSGNWLTQLALGTDNNIYHRNKVNETSFTEWSKLYDSSNVDLDVSKLTTNSKNIIGGINELSNRFKNREIIMNTKNGSAGSSLYMNADYRQYSLLVVSAELDGDSSKLLHQQILCVDTSPSQQRMSINQWGSPNANSIELAFISSDGSVRIDNCLAGAIVKIEGVR